MAVDMKETIAEAACSLLVDRHVKKLTVKDIVEACHITRQAFYYHFEGIPDLLEWVISTYSEKTIEKALATGGQKEGLKCFFVMAASIVPYVNSGLDSNYQNEMDQLMRQYIQHFFTMMAERQGLYENCTKYEADLVIRYHSRAVYGLLREWTEDDNAHLDQIVDTLYRIMTGGIQPRSQKKVP